LPSIWAGPGRERRGGGERKGARAGGNWASRLKVRKGEGEKNLLFFFQNNFPNSFSKDF
jgi:hypothetical protein